MAVVLKVSQKPWGMMTHYFGFDNNFIKLKDTKLYNFNVQIVICKLSLKKTILFVIFETVRQG